MSTLEVSCARCEKRFRVRAEFAGRSTRCPGCSAPITIGDAPRPVAPPKPMAEERRLRRPRDEEDDDEPRKAAVDWRDAEIAFRREQIAVVFALLAVFGSLFSSCLISVNRRSSQMDPVFILVVLLFGIGPALATASFGVMARASALGTPRESPTRGSAVSSMLCGVAGLVSLIALAIAMLANVGNSDMDELPIVVASGGLILGGVGALVTFLGFIAQVGIARRSVEVSRAVGRTAVAIAVCVPSMLGIGLMYTVLRELTDTGPTYVRDSYGGVHSTHDHSGFFQFAVGILIPLAFGVILIMYHRLLAAGRQTVSGETGGRTDD